MLKSQNFAEKKYYLSLPPDNEKTKENHRKRAKIDLKYGSSTPTSLRIIQHYCEKKKTTIVTCFTQLLTTKRTIFSVRNIINFMFNHKI